MRWLQLFAGKEPRVPERNFVVAVAEGEFGLLLSNQDLLYRLKCISPVLYEAVLARPHAIASRLHNIGGW